MLISIWNSSFWSLGSVRADIFCFILPSDNNWFPTNFKIWKYMISLLPATLNYWSPLLLHSLTSNMWDKCTVPFPVLNTRLDFFNLNLDLFHFYLSCYTFNRCSYWSYQIQNLFAHFDVFAEFEGMEESYCDRLFKIVKRFLEITKFLYRHLIFIISHFVFISL
jgi:hypothetical protein